MTTARPAAAAWVPEQSDMDWDEAAAPAVTWTDEQCQDENRTGVLLVHAASSLPHSGPLADFAARHSYTTVGSRATPGTQGIPVLSYCPGPKALAIAMRKAAGSSLCVIEGTSNEWAGWAAEIGATNLLTGEVTPDPRTDKQRDTFRQLDLFTNNGYGDPHAKTSVPRLLGDLLAGGLAPEFIYGVAIARGADERGVNQLAKYVDRIHRR